MSSAVLIEMRCTMNPIFFIFGIFILSGLLRPDNLSLPAETEHEFIEAPALLSAQVPSAHPLVFTASPQTIRQCISKSEFIKKKKQTSNSGPRWQRLVTSAEYAIMPASPVRNNVSSVKLLYLLYRNLRL